MSLIGEKMSELLDQDDDFIGIRFGCRDSEDNIQIWNKDASIFNKNKVLEKIEEMFPNKTKKEYKSTQLIRCL